MRKNLGKIALPALLALLAAICVSCGQVREQRATALITDYMKNEIKNPDSFEVNRIQVDSAFTRSFPTLKREFRGWGCAVNYSYVNTLGIPLTFNGYFIIDPHMREIVSATPNVGVEQFTDIFRFIEQLSGQDSD